MKDIHKSYEHHIHHQLPEVGAGGQRGAQALWVEGVGQQLFSSSNRYTHEVAGGTRPGWRGPGSWWPSRWSRTAWLPPPPSSGPSHSEQAQPGGLKKGYLAVCHFLAFGEDTEELSLRQSYQNLKHCVVTVSYTLQMIIICSPINWALILVDIFH